MNRNPFTKQIDPSKQERCWKCGRLFPVVTFDKSVTHCPSCVKDASPCIGVPTQDLIEMEVCLRAGGNQAVRYTGR